MKASSFLLAVIILIISQRTEAQIDSNATDIRLKFWLKGDPVTLSVQTKVTKNNQYWGDRTRSAEVTIADDTTEVVTCNYPLVKNSLIKDKDHHLTFNVDTLLGFIRNLTIVIPFADSIKPSVFIGGEYFIDFDSLPLIFKNDSWQVPANRYEGWSHDVIVAYGIYDESQEYGIKDDSERVRTIDSLSINLTDFQLHSVVSSQFYSQRDYQSTLRLFGREIFFSPLASSTILRIVNVAGQNKASVPIPAGSTSVHLASYLLPPGCYFARLGTEVAKFVVMP